MNYKNWHDYYFENQNHFSKINFDKVEKLSSKDKKIISKSIQQFQRGENSEGKSLFKYAKDFNEPYYVETIKLFIREEQTHATILGNFMKQNNIPKIKSHWVDNVFRKLRQLTSLENSVTILITAEIIAAIYYQALRDATTSRNLKMICEQILIDEEMHINFQSYTLHIFYEKKSRFRKWSSRLFHRILMKGTILVVWLHHKKVYKTGGFTFKKFYQATWQEFKRAENMLMKNSIHKLNQTVLVPQ